MTDLPITRRQALKASGVSILLSNFAVGQAAARDYPVPPGQGRISGTVTSQSGDPLTGIEVSISSEFGTFSASQITGSDGEYGFSLEPFNTYTISVDEDGYETFTEQQGVGSGEGWVVDIELASLNSKTGTVTGRVVDNGDHKLSNATIEFNDDSSSTVESIKTRDDGSYKITLSAGITYDMTVRKDGFQSEIKEVTVAEAETKTINFTLNAVPSLVVEDSRLVQIVENTRINRSGDAGTGDDSAIGDAPIKDGTPDPSLVADRNTTVIFDLSASGEENISLDKDVELNLTIPSKGISLGSCKLEPQAVEQSTSFDTTYVDLFGVSEIVSQGKYPVFEADRVVQNNVSEIELQLVPEDTGVSGTGSTLAKKSYDFVEMPPLNIGFILVDDKSNIHDGYDSISEQTYSGLVSKSVKFIQEVAPTNQVNFYQQKAGSSVQALANGMSQNNDDNSVLDRSELIGNFGIGVDMFKAQTELDRKLSSGLPPEQTGRVREGAVDQQAVPEIDGFDATIAIVPENYPSAVTGDESIAGAHYTFGESLQPRIATFIVAKKADSETAMHELGHHFTGKPFVGDLAKNKGDEDAQGPAHAREELVSTKIDIADGKVSLGGPSPSDIPDIQTQQPSYMSYESDTWADSLTTQLLIDTNQGPFSPTPPESLLTTISPVESTMSIAGRITETEVSLLSTAVGEITARTGGVSDGVEIVVNTDMGDTIESLTVPSELVATTQDGQTSTVEGIFIADIPLPQEAAEVDISAESPIEGNNVTTSVDTTGALTAGFSLLTDKPTIGKQTRFTAESSFTIDPARNIVNYEWDWTGNGTFETETSSPTTTHIYSTTGEYIIKLRITDDAGNTATTTQKVSVTVGDILTQYANDQGVINADGLQDAVDDWVTQEINIDLLRRAIEAWRNKKDVTKN